MAATKLLMTGATGKQGGAKIEALLSAPNRPEITIFALTRNAESASAKTLVEKSPEHIKLIRGDMNDCTAIFKVIATPINGVFCVSIPAMGPGANSDAEEIQAKALINTALEHGVKHFVYTSVDRHGPDSDSTESDIPHFISKAKIENHLREKSTGRMTWTILRPTAFMDNLTTGFAGKIFPTAWNVGLSPTTKLQLISSADIGYFAARALLGPDQYAGRAISLAGDELTFEEANAVFNEQVGKDIPTTFGFIGSTLIWAVKGVGSMFKFFEEVGYAADIQGLRTENPGLLSLRDWLKTRSVWATEK